MFRKVLVANRGEIAVRIMQTLQQMGVTAAAVYSSVDRAALHVQAADVAWPLERGEEGEAAFPPPSPETFPAGASGGSPPGPDPGSPPGHGLRGPTSQPYLDGERLVALALEHGVDAIHPGYGFLSENPEFAAACEAAGLKFIGPSAEHIRLLGHKNEARARMAASGVPIVPGTDRPIATLTEAFVEADRIGYPLLLKAAMGGGGRGMRRVRVPEELSDAFSTARSEAATAFGCGDVYLEHYIERPRHVEIQVAVDAHGNGVHLFERECSVQRRFQKMIEEAPSPAVDEALRRRMGEAAVAGACSIGYTTLCTFEFLLDPEGRFYFLEVNTRLQVEHPITEIIAGVDLVCLQIRLAAGEPLPFTQEDLTPRGWAFEARINAENPLGGFLPEPGRIHRLELPQGPGVRVDAAVREDSDISPFYDSMVAKLIVSGATREEARRRMLRALDEFRVVGPHTTIPFHQWAFSNEAFAAGDLSTHFLDEQGWARYAQEAREGHSPDEAVAAALAAIHMEQRGEAPPPVAVAAVVETGANPWRDAGRTWARY